MNLTKVGWKKFPDKKINFSLYDLESIYETTPAFLGILENSSATLSQNGVCYVDSCEKMTPQNWEDSEKDFKIKNLHSR